MSGGSRSNEDPIDTICLDIEGVAATLETFTGDLHNDPHSPTLNSLHFLAWRLRKAIDTVLALPRTGIPGQ